MVGFLILVDIIFINEENMKTNEIPHTKYM